MKTEELVINLLNSKSLKDSVIRLFESFPSKERMREILRARKEGTWRKHVPLGVLDDTEVQLVIIKIHIMELISKSENWSQIDRKIYYQDGPPCEGRRQREFERKQREDNNYRKELEEDLKKISKVLIEKIEFRFRDSFPSFLKVNDLLKERVFYCNEYYNGDILISGYDFQVYGDTIFIENMYPMGGD